MRKIYVIVTAYDRKLGMGQVRLPQTRQQAASEISLIYAYGGIPYAKARLAQSSIVGPARYHITNRCMLGIQKLERSWSLS